MLQCGMIAVDSEMVQPPSERGVGRPVSQIEELLLAQPLNDLRPIVLESWDERLAERAKPVSAK